jgi:hypothetical protein
MSCAISHQQIYGLFFLVFFSLSQKMSEYDNLPGQVYFLAYALT